MRKKKAKHNYPPIQYDHDVTVAAYDYAYMQVAGLFFRNGCEEEILIDDVQYIKPKPLGKRLYLIPGQRNNGNKLVVDHANKKLLCSRRLVFHWAKRHVGDFKLKYDRDRLLYYIGE